MCAQINHRFKCVFIGPPGVGKTTFIEKAAGVGGGRTSTTISADIQYLKGNVRLRGDDDDEDLPVTLQVWDTAGDERFRTFTSSFLRDVNVLFVVMRADEGIDEEAIVKWASLADENKRHGEIEVRLLITRRDVVDAEGRLSVVDKEVKEVAKAVSLRLRTNVSHHIIDSRALKQAEADLLLFTALQAYVDKNSALIMRRVHPDRVDDFSDIDLVSASKAELRLVPNRRKECCSQH
jgi:small GTP-binding protein